MAEVVIAETTGSKLKALEAFLHALDIPFKRSSTTSLDRKVKAARNEKRAGTLKKVDPDNLWESIV